MTTALKMKKVWRVLVIEDNPDHWWLIRQALENNLSGVEPIWTSNPLTTIAYLEECAACRRRYPHLILLDLYLPDREAGMTMLRTLRQLPSAIQPIPIVVLSHSDRIEDIRESYALGANSYIVKPLNDQGWQSHVQAITDYWWQSAIIPGIDPDHGR
ncbi:response regulator [Larkinella soli]|uniref:response regulator n=1 Tax=Larkinella soli TaxID=1770527 RepID=UPI000FFB1C89|nr:response regulator [Larkinella soli]